MLSVSRKAAVLAAFLFGMAGLVAQSEGEAKQDPPTLEQMFSRFNPQKGDAKIGDVAMAKLGEGWLWLNGADGRNFLKAMRNQPSMSTLGVAVPPDYAESNVFAVYSYADEGHVEDDEDPDYDKLLQQMKDAAAEESRQRKEAGLQTVEMLGWAEPPHYDRAQHKMYWAERLMFEGQAAETLNYNVRVLGRTGHLVINGVGSVTQLDLVAKHSKELLRVTEFVEGKRYEDFDPSYDKVAAYGIGGLIAGKLALKAGLFAKLGILLVKFLKPILVGVAVLGGLLFKVFGGRKKAAEEEVQPAIEE